MLLCVILVASARGTGIRCVWLGIAMLHGEWISRVGDDDIWIHDQLLKAAHLHVCVDSHVFGRGGLGLGCWGGGGSRHLCRLFSLRA